MTFQSIWTLHVLIVYVILILQTIYGEIIDCVDILKQPAFDHPLLKGHKIQVLIVMFLSEISWAILVLSNMHVCVMQRRPSHLPADGEMVAPDRSGQLDGLSGIFHDCPDETVPIRRTTREDLIREKSLGSSQAVNPDSTADPYDIVSST